MTQAFWYSLLSAPPTELEQWYYEGSRRESLLYWAIKKNLLNENSYLPWARNHYGMAELKMEFFSQQADPVVFAKYENLYAWSPECVPVGEWDDCIYVALLEPQSIVEPPGKKIITVLAPLSGLEQWWKSLSGSDESTEVFSKEMMDELVANEVAGELESKIDSNVVNLAPSIPEEIPAKIPTSIPDAPPAPPSKAPVIPPGPPLEEMMAMEPLEVPENLAPVEVAEESGELLNLNLEVPSVPPAPAAPATKNSLSPLTALSDTISAALPPAPAKEEKAPVAPTPPPTTKTIPTLAALAPSGPVGLQSTDPFDMALHGMSELFEKVLLFKVSGNKITAFKWSANLTKPQNEASYDATKKGFFKIARTTMKPYHGPSVESEGNTIFFKDWLQDTNPMHVTLVPVMHEEECTGMIMGLVAKPGVDIRDALHKAINIGQGLESALQPKPAAAA